MLQYAPDADPSQPGVIYAASNIKPTARGYANYRYPHYADNAATFYTGTPAIMYGHQYSAAGARIIVAGQVGTTAYLYQLKCTGGFGTSFTLADAYTTHWTSVPAGTKWAFTSFGEYVLASSPDIGSIFVQTAINNQFTAVAGSPAARSLCTFKNFVIAGNCQTYGSVTGTPDMVAWSALGDHTSWVPSIATQAGNQQIFDPFGNIAYVKPIGDAVAIYKNSGIVLMRYTGNPASPFSFQRVAGAKGAQGNVGGLVDIGDKHIYVGQDDLYMFDGATTRSITTGRVRDYLLATYYNYSGPMTPSQIQHDPVAGEVLFVAFNLVYNYRYDKWGAYTYSVTVPFSGTVNRAAAVCHSDILVLNNIARASTLTIGADGLFYNRLAPYQIGSTIFYNDMLLSVLRGANDLSSELRRVAPRFISPPAGGSLSYSKRDDMGGPTVYTTTASMTAAKHRFDLAQSSQWHDMTMLFSGTNVPIELADLEYDYAPAGKVTEGRYTP